MSSFSFRHVLICSLMLKCAAVTLLFQSARHVQSKIVILLTEPFKVIKFPNFQQASCCRLQWLMSLIFWGLFFWNCYLVCFSACSLTSPAVWNHILHCFPRLYNIWSAEFGDLGHVTAVTYMYIVKAWNVVRNLYAKWNNLRLFLCIWLLAKMGEAHPVMHGK